MFYYTSYFIQGFLRQPNRVKAREYLGLEGGESAGSDDGGTITESDLDFSDVTTANSSTAQHGLLPKLSGNVGDVLRGNGTFGAGGGGGSGDVVGPASSVDDRIVTFDGATGKLIQDGGALITAVPTQGENDALAGTNGTPSAANPYVTDSDPRNSDARAPNGAAGGVLSGSYPSPGFAVDMATQAELDAVGTVVLDHSARHENGGADEISVAGLSGVLADPQTPATHAATHSLASSDPVDVTDLAGFPGGGTTFLRDDGTFAAAGGGAGTVTSVALTLPTALFDVAGSPVTTAGTFAVTLDNQNANLVFAGPASGGAAAPTMRAMVAADLPVIVQAWDTVIVKSTDQVVTNSIVPVNDTELTTALVANAFYLVELLMLYSANDATGDMRGRFGIPTTFASISMGFTNHFTAGMAPALTAHTNSGTNWPAVDLIMGGGVIAGAANIIRATFMQVLLLTEAASGTLVWQFANSAAAAGRTSTTRAGSTLRVRRLF